MNSLEHLRDLLERSSRRVSSPSFDRVEVTRSYTNNLKDLSDGGYKVSDTVRKEIFDLEMYTDEERLLMMGNLAALFAPAPFSADVRSALDTSYPERWIGRGGPVNWPARSSDISCLDFLLWGHMKSFVYASSANSYEALVSRIAVVADESREMPGVFANVRHSFHRWCEACIFAGGRFFEQFL
ncbi:uncharacterized protein TNCV_2646751 [Trichonephila clavipes]|nr:uncharacterized protein TNCV_2646751 [Trichonephila clavipes]